MHLTGLKGIVAMRRFQGTNGEGRIDPNDGTTELTIMLEVYVDVVYPFATLLILRL